MSWFSVPKIGVIVAYSSRQPLLRRCQPINRWAKKWAVRTTALSFEGITSRGEQLMTLRTGGEYEHDHQLS